MAIHNFDFRPCSESDCFYSHSEEPLEQRFDLASGGSSYLDAACRNLSHRVKEGEKPVFALDGVGWADGRALDGGRGWWALCLRQRR